MKLPDIEKGGKPGRDFAARLRKRLKRGTGEAFTDEENAWLAAWDAKVATMPKGRPPKNDSQSGSESTPEGAAEQPDAKVPPSDRPLPSDSAAPVNSDPPLEAAPKVAAAVIVNATPGDWRAVHRARAKFSDDGRQMLCEMVADGWSEALGAMIDDMKKAGIAPVMGIDPRMPTIKSLAVLAFDELLPSAAKISPKVALVVVTTATVGKRAYHHKAITAALKDDPETIEWRKRQAEREAREQNQRAKHDEEVAAAQAPAEPQYAEPPPPPEVATPINGSPFNANARQAVRMRDDDNDRAPVV